MRETANIYVMTGARYSVGCGYLVATAGTDTKVEVAFGNFVSGGVAVGGEVVTSSRAWSQAASFAGAAQRRTQ